MCISNLSEQQSKWLAVPWTLVIVVCILLADQLSKIIVSTSMVFGQSLPEAGFFRFTYVTNTGMAFGLFPHYTPIPTIATFLGIIVLFAFYRTRAAENMLLKISLGLQMGGAIGNLTDRIRLGYVIDFIDVGAWPVFNLADSAIVTGLTILAYTIFLNKPESVKVCHTEGSPSKISSDFQSCLEIESSGNLLVEKLEARQEDKWAKPEES